jgi:hypothetical protein
MLSIFWFIVYNSFVNLIMVLIEMRRKTNHKLIEQRSYAVDVCSSVMPLAE